MNKAPRCTPEGWHWTKAMLILMIEENAKTFTVLSWMYFTSFPTAVQHVLQNHFLALEMDLQGVIWSPTWLISFQTNPIPLTSFCAEMEYRIEGKNIFY